MCAERPLLDLLTFPQWSHGYESPSMCDSMCLLMSCWVLVAFPHTVHLHLNSSSGIFFINEPIWSRICSLFKLVDRICLLDSTGTIDWWSLEKTTSWPSVFSYGDNSSFGIVFCLNFVSGRFSVLTVIFCGQLLVPLLKCHVPLILKDLLTVAPPLIQENHRDPLDKYSSLHSRYSPLLQSGLSSSGPSCRSWDGSACSSLA